MKAGSGRETWPWILNRSSVPRSMALRSEPQICGSDLGAKICGSEVPATLVPPRMPCCAWPGTSAPRSVALRRVTSEP
jgi:hypothetical protein